MTKIQRLFLPILFTLPFSSVYADIFTCKDSAGHLITSDRAVSECADKATQVYTNNGVLKDQLSGALTPEQKHVADLKEQQRIKEAGEQEKERKEQRYLTAHYPTEQAVELARQKELDAIETKIASEKQAIETATDALTNNQRMQAHIPKNETDKLFDAQINEDSLKQTIQQSNSLIQHYITEKTNINRQFDETHKRYLEVVVSNNK